MVSANGLPLPEWEASIFHWLIRAVRGSLLTTPSHELRSSSASHPHYHLLSNTKLVILSLYIILFLPTFESQKFWMIECYFWVVVLYLFFSLKDGNINPLPSRIDNLKFDPIWLTPTLYFEELVSCLVRSKISL